MKSLAIITARGGSKRIPRKNIKDFLGKPIIAYSIETSLQSNLFDEVMVSTDDNEIAEVARKYGAKVPFMRSAKNADDYSTTSDVLLEVLQEYKKINKTFEYACCIYPTAVLLTVAKLQEVFLKLQKDNYDTVFPLVSFNAPIQRAFKIEEGLAKMFYPEHQRTRSQDLEKAYYDAGQFYWFQTKRFLEEETLLTKNTSSVILSSMETQDIDTLEDWEIAETKYKLLNT